MFQNKFEIKIFENDGNIILGAKRALRYQM